MATTTVDKALGLLGFFSEQQTDIGLSEMARLSGYDKAAVLRMLSAMSAHGFVEQDSETRKYRLGAAFLRFARLRELSSPGMEAVQAILDRLAAEVRETCHFSMKTGRTLSTILVAESPQFTRVHIDVGGELPLTATASGLSVLAFGDGMEVEAVMTATAATAAAAIKRYTPQTVTDLEALRALLNQGRERGFLCSIGMFESEVHSVGAPVFGPGGFAVGAISIAAPASRMSSALEARHAQAVRQACVEATRALGNVVPVQYQALFAPKQEAA